MTMKPTFPAAVTRPAKSGMQQAQQKAAHPDADHIRDAAAQEKNGVEGIFSSAFAHIPPSSPYRPK
jgi:hypothetical protein